MRAAGATAALSVSGVVALLLLASLAGGVLTVQQPPSAAALADIPAPYLTAYKDAAERFELGPDGWAYLAAIGKVESDHGRSTAPGVSLGQNFHGCCAGPMQIHNGFGSGGGTWAAFAVDGDGDRRLDIYDPDDAVATAARYLRAHGAPDDWHAAVFAYNHAGWYVDKVRAQAAAYRAMPPAGQIVIGDPRAGSWLAPVPGAPGERCDRRIVADVVRLIRAYGLRLTDCFGGAPHALTGEHPLGLAVDLVPADGDWSRTSRLARDVGWSPGCATSGCPGTGPFRAVLYNGFPGHGDPRFTSTPHLHLSWQHATAAPFSPARWVRVVTVN